MALRRRIIGAAVLSGLAACGTGVGTESDPDGPVEPGDPPPTGNDLPASAVETYRFLTRATFGPNEFEVGYLSQQGYNAWFTRQFSLPPSLHRPPVEALGGGATHIDRQDVWWKIATLAPDQLRQRVAFALSEFFVISQDNTVLIEQPVGVADYYDLLVQGAFGNYRDLLEDVARSPVMGSYLSHLKNQKADPEENIHPDENFAREIMQLFSIGLEELGQDGTPKLAGGKPIPTYGQQDITEISRAFTGWNFAGATNWKDPEISLEPMENWGEYHDTGSKQILGGAVLPAGQTGEQDLDQVLDLLFQHPNVGPFLGRHLIQRLVTSNPSPAYVSRVAAKFANDGQGVRGNLGAVVRAVLTDPEAKNGHVTDPLNFGKVREPVLRVTALWRAFDGQSQTGLYSVPLADKQFGQAPLTSSTVFNFFLPDYSPPGELAANGLVAPEMQITDDSRIVTTTNTLRVLVFTSYPGSLSQQPDTVMFDYTDELALASDPAALIDHLDLVLLAGQMSPAMRQTLIDYVSDISMTAGGLGLGVQRVFEAVFLIITSPEGAIQV